MPSVLRRSIRRIGSRLLSRRAAVVAMACMLLVMAAASLVPEAPADAARLEELRRDRPLAAWMAEHLRPREVARSPLFLALPAYLFVGVAVSIVDRVRRFRRRSGGGVEARSERFRFEVDLRLLPGPEVAGRLAAGLRSARYRVIAQQEGLVHGVRGEAGFLGSIAFHLGLLLVLAGVVASSLTRVNGEVVLTEGFPVAFTPASMLSLDGGDRFPARAAADSLSIRDFVAEYSPQGTPVDYSLLLSVHRGGERIVEEQVRVNQPFRWQGFQITLHRFGFAPELAARDPSGRLRQDAVTVLQLLPPGRPDTVPLEGGGSLKVRLFPDLAMKGARPQTRSLRPARPVAFFEWQDEAGRTVASGQVERGSEVDAGGYRLAFRSLSYWAGFVVARDRGLWFFVVGSVLGSAGILARLVLPDQTVRIEWGDGRARLLASTRFFPALHREEMARLVRSLEEACS